MKLYFYYNSIKDENDVIVQKDSLCNFYALIFSKLYLLYKGMYSCFVASLLINLILILIFENISVFIVNFFTDIAVAMNFSYLYDKSLCRKYKFGGGVFANSIEEAKLKIISIPN